MGQKKYRHIFFDLDNTLWDFRQNSYHTLKAAFEHFKITGFNVEFDIFFEAYRKNNRELWQQYRNKTVSKKELIARRFATTFDDFNISGIDPVEMNTFYLDTMPEQTLLIEGALETLNYLKRKNYLLYIITNGFSEVQRKKLASSGIQDFFTKIFTSEDIKMPKPATEVFEYAVKSSNARKSESIMVGDDWEVDILGALKFGMDAVYFPGNGATEIPGHSSANKVFRIQNLAELREIL